jgi:hypothetical protein
MPAPSDIDFTTVVLYLVTLVAAVAGGAASPGWMSRGRMTHHLRLSIPG